MKKFLLSILTVMYMTVSSGIAMEIHYCMGEKAGVDFYKGSDNKCGRCGMKEQGKDGCCQDDHKFYKLDDSHQKAASDYSLSFMTEPTVPHFTSYDADLTVTGTRLQFNNHSPPPYLPRPARILHGVFRL